MASDVANPLEPPWPVEVIPDADHLYMRVQRNQVDPEGEPFPHAFKNQPTATDGMSTDWSRYRIVPEDTRNGARKPPEEYAVVQLSVADTRAIPGQTVKHEPLDANRAHTEVFGEKSTEVREKFMQVYKTVVPLGTPA